MSVKEEKIQIAAFSTIDVIKEQEAIINMFLENNDHIIIKKTLGSIAFETTLTEMEGPQLIMIVSILFLRREYPGIKDVNCYILFIELEKEESKEKLEVILKYAKKHCDLTRKIYVLGIVSGIEKTKHMTKEDITKIFDSENATYEYKEINLSKPIEVSDTFKEIFIYSTTHLIGY